MYSVSFIQEMFVLNKKLKLHGLSYTDVFSFVKSFCLEIIVWSSDN
jgi:hypothetical protein